MKKIHIYEVGPRDGFQNLKEFLPTEEKLRIIGMIADAGVRHIQVTSFVSPKAVPQMQDSNTVARTCLEKYPDADIFALVPNLYGAKAAWDTGIKTISYVVSLSKSHNKANINRTHEESFTEFAKIRESYPDLRISLDLSTAFGCPFEGKTETKTIVAFLKDYVQLGVQDVNLCDTIAVANPAQIREVIAALKSAYPSLILQVHIHDTRNMGMVNTLAAIECGIDKVQSTLGGLGGCPFAPGASGNLATEDLVYMLNEMDCETGVDFQKLLEAAKYEKKVIAGGTFSGHHINIKSSSCRISA